MSAIYKAVCRVGDKIVPTRYQAFWNHPAGTEDSLNMEIELPSLLEFPLIT